MLFGEYSKNINSQAVKMIQTANVKTGDSVEVYGVFSARDIPQTLRKLPRRKSFMQGTIIWRRTISSLPSPLSPK